MHPFFRQFQNREAAEQRRKKQEQVVSKGSRQKCIRQAAVAQTHESQEEVAQLGDAVGAVENTEAHDNNDLVEKMTDNRRDFLHALFPDAHFQENKETIVNAPDNVVPACAVP